MPELARHHLITSARHPVAGVADRRQPQRRHPAHAADPGHPAGTRSPRAPATTAGHGVCRPWLRPRQVSQASSAVGVTPVIAGRGTDGSGWAGTAGSSSRRLPCCIVSGDCASVGSSATTSTRHSFACVASSPPPADQPVTLLGLHLPGFRGRIDRMLGRSPGECREGQHAPIGARRPTISSPRTPTCQPTRNTRRSSRSPCALRFSHVGLRMTPSAESDGRDVCLPGRTRLKSSVWYWPGGRSVSSRLRPPKPRVITAMQPPPVAGRPQSRRHPLPLGRRIPIWYRHGDVIVSEGSGDEVLRGEDVVARKPVSTNCPPPLRPGPASSCLVTAIAVTRLWAGY